jgi:glycosyl transferase family 25
MLALSKLKLFILIMRVLSEMFEFIEKVVYINLDSRTDRRLQIEAELAVFPSDKVLRFSAIKEENGNHGCSKSHIAVLEMAITQNWSNVLIIEDDAKWHKFEIGYAILERLIKEKYDVISLGGIGGRIDLESFRAINFQTTTAYLVSNHYYNTLLNNFKEGLEILLASNTYHSIGCIDQHWKLLHNKDKWFRIYPHLLYQQKGYSDIIKRVVDYTGPKHFDITEA